MDLTQLDGRAGNLRAKGQRGSLIRLQFEDECVGFEFFSLGLAEEREGGAFELDGNLRAALCHPFARPQIEGHTGPAPSVYAEFHGDIGLGETLRVDTFLLTVSLEGLSVAITRLILTADHVCQGIDKVNCIQNFGLLGSDGIRAEGVRGLHAN